MCCSDIFAKTSFRGSVTARLRSLTPATCFCSVALWVSFWTAVAVRSVAELGADPGIARFLQPLEQRSGAAGHGGTARAGAMRVMWAFALPGKESRVGLGADRCSAVGSWPG